MISEVLAVLETREEQNIYAAFYEKYKNRFLTIAYSRLHSKNMAEDAVEEAFMQIARKPEKFFGLSDEEKLRYFDVVVKNLSIRMFNKSAKQEHERIDYHESEFFSHISLEDKFFDKISRNEIIDFINKLPQLQRNVLILICLNDFSIDDVSDTLNISRAAVNQRLYLARKSIKEFIAERKK